MRRTRFAVGAAAVVTAVAVSIVMIQSRTGNDSQDGTTADPVVVNAVEACDEIQNVNPASDSEAIELHEDSTGLTADGLTTIDCVLKELDASPSVKRAYVKALKAVSNGESEGNGQSDDGDYRYTFVVTLPSTSLVLTAQD